MRWRGRIHSVSNFRTYFQYVLGLLEKKLSSLYFSLRNYRSKFQCAILESAGKQKKNTIVRIINFFLKVDFASSELLLYFQPEPLSFHLLFTQKVELEFFGVFTG